jgi:dolichyl-phosphate beta-glucosyltransferase
MGISIVIPAYNEEKRLEDTLKKIISFMENQDYEIIVVDDGSNDNTFSIASKYNVKVLRNKENRGKGYSVKRGILNASKDFVLFTDSDLATQIEELSKFMKLIKDYDIIIASRNLKESKIIVKQAKFRQFLGKTFPILIRMFVLRGIKDTQCGFKLFKTSIAKEIVKLQTLDRFAFDVELLYIAKKKGFKVKEEAVTWIDKEGSKVGVLKDSFNMLIDSFRILLNDLKGRY